MWQAWKRQEMLTRFWLKNQKQGNLLRDPETDKSKILT